MLQAADETATTFQMSSRGGQTSMKFVVCGVGAAGTFAVARLAELSAERRPDGAWSGVEVVLVDTPTALGRGRAFDAAEALGFPCVVKPPHGRGLSARARARAAVETVQPVLIDTTSARELGPAGERF